MNLLLPAGHSQLVSTDDGAALAVTIAGAGPTVILAHGWTCRREFWALVADRLLSTGHRVVLYDQRGHGSSTGGSAGFTVARLGDDLRAVLDAVDARDAVVVGHSMGGMAVLAYAVDAPDAFAARFAALVLVSTRAHGLGTGRVERWAPRVLGSRWFEWLMRSPLGPRIVQGTFGAASGRDRHRAVRDLFVTTDAGPRRACVEAMQRFDLRSGLAGIDVPTVVVTGALDTLVPTALSDELAAAIPRARLVRLPGLGHQLPLEAPDELAAIITELAAAT